VEEDPQGNAVAPTLRRLQRVRGRTAGLLGNPRAPTFVLGAVLALSLLAHVIDLQQPCTSPCRTVASHTLVFDESYYVNAARVIDGINPPKGAPYHNAPKGKDPNAEHPQLAKVIMAGFIELLGDDPAGWRIGSVLFAMIALAALYWLVRSSGGSQWLAVGATSVMSLDNLLLVHSRLATLDIYGVAMMLVAGALYMRGSPILSGIALGVAACMKEVSLYLLFVLAVLELLRVGRAHWVRGSARGWMRFAGRPLLLTLAATAVSFVGLLWLLDVLVPAYDPVKHVTYAGNPFSHLWHIYKYALKLNSGSYVTGISSTPWQWLLDQKVIQYARLAFNTDRAGKLIRSHTLISYVGEINPFIIFLAVPALLSAAVAAWRESNELATVGVAWCLGAFLPFAVESGISGRITYIYYMVIVMPGIYILVSMLIRKLPRAAIFGWGLMLLYSFVELYPLRTLL
jgi:4-amino-4-deoxy-L-arabinose transferase-like glycosyltransferase